MAGTGRTERAAAERGRRRGIAGTGGLGALLPLLLVASAPINAVTAAPGAWFQRDSYLMGTVLQTVVEGVDREHAMAATEAALAEVRRLEDLLSTWDEGSALSSVNRAAPGKPLPITRELAGLLLAAGKWQEETGGAFHPAVGSLVDAWDLRGSGRVPTGPELTVALAALQSGIRADAVASTATRLHPDAWVDTGAWGKGVALQAAAEVLDRHGVRNALLNFGGQVLALGAEAGETGWRIPVAHPVDRDRRVAALRLSGVSASTTGASERFIEVGGQRWGHVLDPRSGRPVPAWGSVTVVHPDAMVADILSTALFVMGPVEGMQWLEARPQISALFVADGPSGLVITPTAAMERWLETGPGGNPPAVTE